MQWRTLLGIVLALIVAVFAVANVRSEAINYVFGVAYVPLVLIILGSALLGALAVGIPGIMSRMRLKNENRRMSRELDRLEHAVEAQSGIGGPERESRDSAVTEIQ